MKKIQLNNHCVSSCYYVLVIIIALAVAIMFSCQENDLTLSKGISTPHFDVKNSRLQFSSRQNIRDFLNNLEENNDETLERKLEALYDQGFMSFRPIVNIDDEERLIKVSESIIGKILNSKEGQFSKSLGMTEEQIIDKYFEESENLIGSDEFASLINADGEIQVADSLYKYTKQGLFITHQADIQYLYKYLEGEESSTENYGINSNLRINQKEVMRGFVQVTPKILRYLPSLPFCDFSGNCFGGGGGGTSGGGGSGTGGSSGTSGTSKQEAIDNLRICEYRPNFLNKVFGPSETCISHWSSKYRIKTAFYNQNYLLFSTVVSTVKSQRRRFRIWWRNKIDELELGFDLVSYSFEDYSNEFQNNFLSSISTFGDYVYEYDGYLISQNGTLVQDKLSHRLFDSWPIADPDSRKLIIYVLGQNRPLIDFNERAKDLIGVAWNSVASKFRIISKNQSVVIVSMESNGGTMHITYNNYRIHKRNDRKITKRFDFNTARIGVSASGGNASPTFKLAKSSVKNFKVTMYGIGKKGSIWKGGKIVLD